MHEEMLQLSKLVSMPISGKFWNGLTKVSLCLVAIISSIFPPQMCHQMCGGLSPNEVIFCYDVAMLTVQM